MRLAAVAFATILVAGVAVADDKAPTAATPAATPARAPRAAAESAGHGSARVAPESTAEFMKWVDLCVQHLGSSDAGVHQGAHVALRAAGSAAKPALEKAAAGDNPKIAQSAKSLLDQLAAPPPHVAEGGHHGRPGAPPRGGQPGAAIVRQLGLSSEQQPKVTEILGAQEKAQQEIAKNARDGKMPKDEAKGKIAAVRADTEKKLSAALTAEPLKKYKDLSPTAQAAPTSR
jgi:Spy/CpxP family protein refolding chaperone